MAAAADIFANNLKGLRERRGHTQDALGSLVGVDGQTIRNYEGRRRWPSPEVMDRLATALRCQVGDFFMGDAYSPPEVSPEEALAVIAAAIRTPAPTPERRELIELISSPALDDAYTEVLLKLAKARSSRAGKPDVLPDDTQDTDGISRRRRNLK